MLHCVAGFLTSDVSGKTCRLRLQGGKSPRLLKMKDIGSFEMVHFNNQASQRHSKDLNFPFTMFV